MDLVWMALATVIVIVAVPVAAMVIMLCIESR